MVDLVHWDIVILNRCVIGKMRVVALNLKFAVGIHILKGIMDLLYRVRITIFKRASLLGNAQSSLVCNIFHQAVFSPMKDSPFFLRTQAIYGLLSLY